MKDYAEGKITEIRTNQDTIIYNAIIPAIVCLPETSKCIPIDFMIDSGSDKSMISYNFGNELGLKPPGKGDKKYTAKDVNGRDVPYIFRKVDLRIGTIEKKNFEICWCTAPRIKLNLLGMDFFHDHKLIINGRTKKFYISKHDVCVTCKK